MEENLEDQKKKKGITSCSLKMQGKNNLIIMLRSTEISVSKP